ncbi:MAG: 4Fe-4S dicluster domain-containing protein [Anaerolineales bacterium]|jgi:ferredoxin|nr:4Fe-4S dicluster domain-containing protein [Anaerolineales bacterium]
MSLLDAAERFASLDRSQVILDAERCLHTRDQHSECAACFNICPVGAITPGQPPSLDPKKCEGCLACLTVCPVGAYSADDAVTPLLNAVTHLEDQTLELLCELNPACEAGIAQTSVGIQVRGCLAGLGSGTYLALAALGLEQVVARTDACSTCKWAALQPEVEAQVARAKELLAAWGRGDSLRCVSGLDQAIERPLWNASNPPLSRRDLFRMLARQGQVAMARAMQYGQTQAGPRPGRNHKRTVNALGHLPAPSAAENLNLGEFGFGSLQVSAACTACAACARACPTGALQFEKDEDQTTFALKFAAPDCVACGLCVHVCAPDAIRLDRSPQFADIFGDAIAVLQAGELIKCEQCAALTAKRGATRLCELCQYRRENRFGSVLPPGFKRNKPVAVEQPDDY